MTADQARDAVAGVVLAAAERVESRFWLVSACGVVDASDRREAGRIARHLIASDRAHEWRSVPPAVEPHLRTAVRLIRRQAAAGARAV